MLKCLLIAAIFAASVSAQGKVSFDLLKYVPPAGWAETKSVDVRQYSKEVDGKFCLITLYKPVPTSKSPRETFDTVWKSLVEDEIRTTTPPTMGTPGPKNGWMGELGIAPFENTAGKGAAFLTTLTGSGKVVAVLILTNSEDFQTEMERFVDNIELPAIAQTAQPKVPARSQPVPANENASKLIGRWQRSSSGIPSYADPASWGTAGYTKSRYEFKPDGTYVFTERSFRYTYQNIIVVKETGRYTVSGDSLTIAPAKSTITAYSKAGGVDALGGVVKTQNRALEKTTYRFTFHYFSGIQEWNFVLMADSPTQRDGPFSNNKSFENAWYYDQKYIDTDLTAARVD